MPDQDRASDGRPLSASLAAAALIGLAGLSALAGLALTAVSDWMGVGEPDSAYAVIGLVTAGLVGAAGVGLWSGSMPRRRLLGFSSALLAACAAGAFSSTDFAALLLPAAGAWMLFWRLLRRPDVTRGTGG